MHGLLLQGYNNMLVVLPGMNYIFSGYIQGNWRCAVNMREILGKEMRLRGNEMGTSS